VNDTFLKLFNGFKEFFDRLSPARKVLLVVTAVMIVSTIVMMFRWAGDNTYQILYRELSDQDSTKIIRMLRDKDIPFKTEDGGRIIKVPPEQVYDFRLEASNMGYPQSGVVGYEVFDEESFGTTSFVQKLNKKRALEGELVRTINHIRGVKRSRVHLAMPPKTTFIEERKEPTASVVLELEPGFTPREGQIHGVAHLVASAVPEMNSSNVVIVSDSGKQLSKNFQDSATSAAANRIEMQMKVDKELEDRVEQIVGKVVGEGRVIAKVRSVLNFDETSEEELIVDNESKAVQSQVVDENTLVGQRPTPQGVPGARTNIPGEFAEREPAQTRQDINKKMSTNNYLVPKKVRRTKKDTGNIKNLSVAVMIDKKKETITNEDGSTEVVTRDWTEEELDTFRSIIASAIHIDESRGDQLQLKSMAFHKEDLEAAQRAIEAMNQRKLTYMLIQYGGVGILILLFFLLVVRPFVKWLTENSVDVVEDFLPKTLEELEKVQSQQGLPGMEDAVVELDDKVDPEKMESEMIKEKVVSLVNSHPDKAAMILSDWVHFQGSSQDNVG
jgi:flagellar M-ring protein FliF